MYHINAAKYIPICSYAIRESCYKIDMYALYICNITIAFI